MQGEAVEEDEEEGGDRDLDHVFPDSQQETGGSNERGDAHASGGSSQAPPLKLEGINPQVGKEGGKEVAGAALMTKEDKQQGKVPWKLYWYFIKQAGGFRVMLAVALLLILGQGVIVS